jgi:hypothetical protein
MSLYVRDNFEQMSIHEMLKQEMVTEEPTKTVQTNGDYIDHFIILDSFVKAKDSAVEKGEYKWNFNMQGQMTDESIGVNIPIDYVIEMQLGNFYMPVLEDVTYIDNIVQSYGQLDLIQNNTSAFNQPPTLIRRNPPILGQYPLTSFKEVTENFKMPWINNPYTQIPFCNRISIYIKETGLQSFVNLNNIRSNFEFIASPDFRLQTNPNFIHIYPVNTKWDFFTFNSPIRNFNTCSLIFRNPDKLITFEPDVMYNSVINLTDDGIGGHITLFTQYEHKLLAGDRIYMKNFSPKMPDGSINSEFPQYLINYITRPDGHVINVVAPTIIPPLDPSYPIGGIAFGLDPSVRILNPIPVNIIQSFPGLVDIYIAKRRIRIPLKLKSIKK